MPQRRYRCSWDDIATLDADHMASWGAFAPGRLATIDFEGSHLPTKTMVFEMQVVGDRFHAFYEWTPHLKEPITVRAEVFIERRPCRFGGTRAYFIAPCCDRRILRLAALDRGLQCARCGGVTWRSRRERPVHRVIRKANKVAQQLGCESWMDRPKERPKHMRQATFELLQLRQQRLVAKISGHIRGQIVRRGLLR
jgi:hypothetical protein